MEPQDPVARMPLLLGLVNLLAFISSSLPGKLWRNRFSYEPVGNFVYKISERELEKFGAGLNLPLVAFKRINPNFYFKDADNSAPVFSNRQFFLIYLKKQVMDVLVRLGLLPSQVLSAVIFKQLPDADMIAGLKLSGYHLVYIPQNPYL